MRNRRRARIKHRDNRHFAEARIIGSKRAAKSEGGVGLIKPHAAATPHRFRGEKITNTTLMTLSALQVKPKEA